MDRYPLVLGFKAEEEVLEACRPRSVSDFCVRCLEPIGGLMGWTKGHSPVPHSRHSRQS